MSIKPLKRKKKTSVSVGRKGYTIAIILTTSLISPWHFQMALFVTIKNDGKVEVKQRAQYMLPRGLLDLFWSIPHAKSLTLSDIRYNIGSRIYTLCDILVIYVIYITIVYRHITITRYFISFKNIRKREIQLSCCYSFSIKIWTTRKDWCEYTLFKSSIKLYRHLFFLVFFLLLLCISLLA